MAEQSISIKYVLDDLLRHPVLSKDLELEAAVAYTVDFMKLVGVPNMFTEQIATINIKAYKGVLPEDYYEMRQVRDAKTKETYRYSTNSFHLFNDGLDYESYYKIQNNIIHTTLEEGELEIVYLAIDTDEEGFPMLPNKVQFIRALKDYIKKEHFRVLFECGKIPVQIYQNADQQYAWSIAACNAEFNRLTIDKMMALSNSLSTIILNRYHHKSGYKDLGTRELLIKH